MDENLEEAAVEWKGYQKTLLTIDLVRANRTALYLIVPVALLYAVPFYFFHIKGGNGVGGTLPVFSWGIFLKGTFIFIGGILAHELVHGLTWSFFAKKGFRSIRFGVLWNMLTPYCHCKEPLRIKHYLIGAIMPFIVVGLVPALYAIVVGSVAWLFFGFFYTIGAVGDFLIIHLLRKEKMNDFAQDHPSLPGCWVYRKEASQ